MQLTRAAVELAKNWRMDKYLRRLDVSRRLWCGLIGLARHAVAGSLPHGRRPLSCVLCAAAAVLQLEARASVKVETC